jgi:hypothetical protein
MGQLGRRLNKESSSGRPEAGMGDSDSDRVSDDDSGWRRCYELSRTANKFAGKIAMADAEAGARGKG